MSARICECTPGPECLACAIDRKGKGCPCHGLFAKLGREPTGQEICDAGAKLPNGSDCSPPPRTAPAREGDRNRLVRLARERLGLARETEDDDAAEAARAVLASLEVDEAGDDLQPGEEAS